MTLKARVFIGFVAALGWLNLAFAVPQWHTNDLARFLSYFVVATFAASLNIRYPTITHLFSVNFLFILLGIVELNFTETLTLGCAATLAQFLWDPKMRSRPGHIVVGIGILSTAIASAHLAYRSFLPEGLDVLAVRLLVAAGTFFVANTFPVSVRISLNEHKRIGETWRRTAFWSFPYYLVGAAMAGAVSIGKSSIGWQSAILILPVLLVTYRSYRVLLGRVEDQKKHSEELSALHLRTIEALALAIEAKDQNAIGHLRRVQVYAVEVGKELGLKAEELAALRAAALLHDIGKLAVPEHILNKPGRLTPEEFAKVKVHPLVGAEILQQVKFPYAVAPIVRSHHEKWDGSGYPVGLKDEEIPIGARILAAVDCLDALASDRDYRRALSLDEAMERVAAEAGSSYDPRVTAILERRYVELEKLAKIETEGYHPRLSTDVLVEHGLEPAAGLQRLNAALTDATEKPADFLAPIAAARREGQVFLEMAGDLARSLDLDETLPLLADRLQSIVPFRSLVVFVEQEGNLKARYAAGRHARFLSSLTYRLGQGLVGRVATTGNPALNEKPGFHEGSAHWLTHLPELESALAVPLKGDSGTIGVLALYSQQDSFTDDHVRILLAICPKLSLAIENSVRYRRAEDSAATDFLTTLPNKRAFSEMLNTELARAKRLKQGFAVLICDLDGFKPVNDRYGHLTGDRVLQAIAVRMKEQCREYECVARVGGDEFAFILPSFRREYLNEMIQRLTRIAVEGARSVCGHDVLSLSVGESFYPDDGSDAAALIVAADQRMYRMKQRREAQLGAAACAPASKPAAEAAANALAAG